LNISIPASLDSEKKKKKKINKEMVTIGTKRGASDSGELLAGIDVFDDRFVETGEVFVALFQHRLYAVWLHLEPHSHSQIFKNLTQTLETNALFFTSFRSFFLSLLLSTKPRKP
jgi:hypothetical protein